MKKFFNARLMLILSMAIFGTIGLFRRNIDISSGELAFYRAVLATVFIGLFLLVTKSRIPFAKIKKQIPLLIISGTAMAFNWILLFEAYNYTTVSAATLSYYFAPVLVTLLCPVLFKEKMTCKHHDEIDYAQDKEHRRNAKTVLESFHDRRCDGFGKTESHDGNTGGKAFVILEPEHERLNGGKVSYAKTYAHDAAVEQIDQNKGKRTSEEFDRSTCTYHAYCKANGRYER